MSKKLVSLMVSVLLLALMPATTVKAGGKAEAEAKFAERVKVEIAKLGTGPDAQIEVKLLDKTKLKGYVGQTDDREFVVVDAKSGVATKVLYPQVRTVKGNNLSYGVKVAIGFGIVILALVIFCSVHGCAE